MLIVALSVGLSAADTITLANGMMLSGRLVQYESGGTCAFDVQEGGLVGAQVLIDCNSVIQMEHTVAPPIATTRQLAPAYPAVPSATPNPSTMSGGVPMQVEDPAGAIPVHPTQPAPYPYPPARGQPAAAQPAPVQAAPTQHVEVVNGVPATAPTDQGQVDVQYVDDPQTVDPNTEPVVAEPNEEVPAPATSPEPTPPPFESKRVRIIEP